MATLRPRFDRIWAASGQMADPGLAKYAQGWTAEIPTYEVLNFLQNRTDTALVALAETGIPEWGDDVTYRRGAPVWDNEAVYYAKVASPLKTKRPSQNADQWGRSAITYADTDFLSLSARINAHEAATNNPHKVTSDQVGTYKTGVIDQKIAVVQNDLNAFKARRDNPHAVTAAQAGAVPITGGIYQGQVTMSHSETLFAPSSGNYAMVGSSAVAGIRAGKNHLGIEPSTGRAIFLKDGVKSYLLSEAEYEEYRETVEAEYSIPTPYYEIAALSDIHLRHGIGSSGITRPSSAQYVDRTGTNVSAPAKYPRHTADGLLLDGRINEALSVTAQGNVSGLYTFTMNFEGDWIVGIKTLFAVDAPSSERLRINADKTVELIVFDNGVSKSFKTPPLSSSTFNITWVRTSTSMQVFVDGEKLIGVSGTFGQFSTSAQIMYHGLNENGSAALRSVRLWRQALTAKQVSTI